MSNKFKITLEDNEEVLPVIEDSVESVLEEERLQNSIDSDVQEIDKQSDLVEGLESLRMIAERIGTPSPTEVALFKVAANMAVSGTKNNAQDFLPAMESSKPIALENFGDKIKEIVRNIIAKLKEFWDKIIKFFKNVFNKEKKVIDFNNKLNEEVKAKEEEIKKDDVEVTIVKTPEVYKVHEINPEIIKSNIEKLEKHDPIRKVDLTDTINLVKKQTELMKEVNDVIAKILIPEEVDIYSKESKAFPKTTSSSVYVYMNQGNYLGQLNIFLKQEIERIVSCRTAIRSGYTAMRSNMMDLEEHLKYYFRSKAENRKKYEEEIKNTLNKVKLNHSHILNTFIKTYANPSLLQMKPSSNESYHCEIVGGYGFQTILGANDQVLDIHFNNNYNQQRLVKEVCKLELDKEHISKCIGYRKDIIKSLSDDSKSFSDMIEYKMDLNQKMLKTLGDALNHLDLDQDGINIINSIKNVLLNIDKFILTLSKFDNFILDVLYEADVIGSRVLKLYK